MVFVLNRRGHWLLLQSVNVFKDADQHVYVVDMFNSSCKPDDKLCEVMKKMMNYMSADAQKWDDLANGKYIQSIIKWVK